MGQYMLLLVGRAAQPQATDAETRHYNARWMEYFGALARSGLKASGNADSIISRGCSSASMAESNANSGVPGTRPRR